MSDKDLRVCPRCGWYLPSFSTHTCREKAGRLADAIAAAAKRAGYPSTKLGYGDGKLTVYCREKRNEDDIPPHITFDVDDERVSIDDVWSVDSFTGKDAIEIIVWLFSSKFARSS